MRRVQAFREKEIIFSTAAADPELESRRGAGQQRGAKQSDWNDKMRR